VAVEVKPPVIKVAPIKEIKVKTPIEEIQELLDESPAVKVTTPVIEDDQPQVETPPQPPQEVRFDLLPAVTFHIEHRGTHRAFDTDKQMLVNTCLDRPDTYAVYAPNGALVRR